MSTRTRNGTIEPSSKRAAPAGPVFWAAIVILAAGSAWLLMFRPNGADQPVAPIVEVSLLPETVPPCRLSGSDAQTRARSLEQMADARWERVVYAVEEAPTAVLQVREAERCYAASADREGRLRAESKGRAFTTELTRRFERAQLMLEMARRNQRDADVREHANTLLSLLSRAGEGAQRYRRWLEDIERSAAARQADRLRSSDEEN